MSPFGSKQSDAQEAHIGPLKLSCRLCDHDRFWERKAQMNTAGFTFLNLDWANASATCFVCDRCGYVHWFLPRD